MTKKEQPKNQPRGHEFDGIQEYDNDMPKWWVYLFILTIIFAIFYMAWFHLPFFPSKSLSGEYDEAALSSAAAAKLSKQDNGGGAFDYKLAVNDGGMVERGKETYTSTCSPCHGPDGGGVVGPNLTDEFWIHGGTPEKIQALISEGAVEKGMPSWEPVLGLDKVRELTVYVMTLKGTKPVTPKDPQGAKEVTQ